MAFDCLRLRGRDLRPLPLRDRRKTVEDVVAAAEAAQRPDPADVLEKVAANYRGALLAIAD